MVDLTPQQIVLIFRRRGHFDPGGIENVAVADNTMGDYRKVQKRVI